MLTSPAPGTSRHARARAATDSASTARRRGRPCREGRCCATGRHGGGTAAPSAGRRGSSRDPLGAASSPPLSSAEFALATTPTDGLAAQRAGSLRAARFAAALVVVVHAVAGHAGVARSRDPVGRELGPEGEVLLERLAVLFAGRLGAQRGSDCAGIVQCRLKNWDGGDTSRPVRGPGSAWNYSRAVLTVPGVTLVTCR